jgi:hypothetical protein
MVGQVDRPVLVRRDSLRAPAPVLGRADTREPDIALRGRHIKFSCVHVQTASAVRPALSMLPSGFEHFLHWPRHPAMLTESCANPKRMQRRKAAKVQDACLE